MMRKTLWLALLAISACASPARHHSDPVPMANKDPAAMLTWTELSARPLPPSGLRIAYGDGPEQFGELRLPASTGPHPVVVLIHGGCWLSDFDYRYMTHLGDALATQGYASWTIEYRRLGASGGGWPQTFTDVGLALDALRDIAATQPLALGRIVTVGHSAGGQLALWLAARPRYHVHFTPTYSSWLNQVETWFNILTRKAIRRGSDRSVNELVARIERFVASHNRKSQPFTWLATADSIFQKLERLCKKISGTGH